MSNQPADPSAPQFPPIPATTPEPDLKPLVEGLTESPATHFPPVNQTGRATPGGPKPAELDQDAGGGYNSNRTYPQT